MNHKVLCWTCIVGISWIWIQDGLCATGADAKALRTELFVNKSYDSKVRPSDNQTDPIEVYVELYLLSINDLSEVTETMKVTSYLRVYWTDEFLKWDPTLFGDLDYYFYPQGDVWKPDIALKNSNLEYKELGVPSLNVMVQSTGEVTWSPFQVFESTCSMDIMYFPFDVQECKLEFVAWSYSKAECEVKMEKSVTEGELFLRERGSAEFPPKQFTREVSLDLSLWSIIELSEVTETMKITAVLAIRWLDPFLEWNPDQYGGISSYQWPQGDVWKPEIVLKNSNQQYKEIGMPSMNVNIVANGYVGWYPFQVFESTCNIDIMYFPFDVQECKLEFVVWNYSSDEVDLTSEDKAIDMDEFQENSEWTVIDTGYKVDPESPYSAVIYTIKLKRKPLYYLLSIIMPIVMLAVLNIFAFVLPSESGEKASYAITVFLSFTVLQTIFATSVPKNSEVVPLFAIYVIILTLQSTMITLLTLVSVRCCSFDAKVDPVPRWVRAFLRIVGCRPCRETRYLKVRRNSEPEGAVEIARDQDITRKHEKPEPTDVSRSNDYTWKEVVNLFDRIGFVLFTTFLVTETIVFFYVTVNNK